MKLLKFLLLIILFTACSPDEIEIYDDISQDTTLSEPIKIPQKIYNSSTLNHEWNSGYFNELTMDSPYNFFAAFTYLDYDEDGDMDVFAKVENVGHEHEINTLFLLINEGNGEWTPKFDAIPKQTGIFYRRLTTADIDNDGDMDVVGFVADEPMYGNNNPRNGGVDLFRFEDGIFTYENIVPYEVKIDTWFHGGELADINNDGLVDIIGSNHKPTVYLNKGNGIFDSREYFNVGHLWNGDEKGGDNGVQVYDMEFVDLNNDGLLDMVCAPFKNPHFFFANSKNDMENYQIGTEIYYNTGVYPYYDSTSPYTLGSDYLTENVENAFCDVNDHAFIDYNNDGFVDIFTVSSTSWTYKKEGLVQYYENNGDGTFTVNNDIFVDGHNELFKENFPNPTGTNMYGEGGRVWHIKAWDINNNGNIELLIEQWGLMGFNMWYKDPTGKLRQSTY